MRLIMKQIEPEHSELFVLEFRKIAESDFCDHKISDEIDYGFNLTRPL